jgi:hypothetical protein
VRARVQQQKHTLSKSDSQIDTYESYQLWPNGLVVDARSSSSQLSFCGWSRVRTCIGAIVNQSDRDVPFWSGTCPVLVCRRSRVPGPGPHLHMPPIPILEAYSNYQVNILLIFLLSMKAFRKSQGNQWHGASASHTPTLAGRWSAGPAVYGWTTTQPYPCKRRRAVSGVDSVPDPHSKKGNMMGGRTLSVPDPPSIYGTKMGGPHSNPLPELSGVLVPSAV